MKTSTKLLLGFYLSCLLFILTFLAIIKFSDNRESMNQNGIKSTERPGIKKFNGIVFPGLFSAADQRKKQ